MTNDDQKPSAGAMAAGQSSGVGAPQTPTSTPTLASGEPYPSKIAVRCWHRLPHSRLGHRRGGGAFELVEVYPDHLAPVDQYILQRALFCIGTYWSNMIGATLS